MKHFFILSLFLLSFVGYSQKYELGKVSLEEINEKRHPKDTSAAAAILFKKGKVTFEYEESSGFLMKTEVKTRIKIYKKTGYDWANQVISYYSGGSDERKETIMIELTDQQIKAINAYGAEPPVLFDPNTKTHYVLLRQEVYEQLKEYDDSPWTDEEMELLAWEAGKLAGWEEMDEYDIRDRCKRCAIPMCITDAGECRITAAIDRIREGGPCSCPTPWGWVRGEAECQD